MVSMDFYVLTLMTAILGMSCANDIDTCPMDKTTRLSISTSKNSTGHWIISAGAVLGEAGNSAHFKPRTMTVDVEHGVASCRRRNVISLSATATVGGRRPPADYVLVEGFGYYKAHSNALAWVDARDKCEEEGAHLMILNSDGEAQVFKTLFANKGTLTNTTDTSYAHLGFHDIDREGDFVTVLGEPFATAGYAMWAPGNPGGGTGQNCGEANGDAVLYDDPCDHRQFFVCEYSPS